jgi:hypothetical protein
MRLATPPIDERQHAELLLRPTQGDGKLLRGDGGHWTGLWDGCSGFGFSETRPSPLLFPSTPHNLLFPFLLPVNMPRTTRPAAGGDSRWDASFDFEAQLRAEARRRREEAAARQEAANVPLQPGDALGAALAAADQVLDAAGNDAAVEGTEVVDPNDVAADSLDDDAQEDEAMDEAVVDGRMAREEDEAELAEAERVANAAAARAAAVTARAEADAARAAAAAAARGAANVIRPAFSRPVASAAAALPNIARGNGKGKGAKRHRKVCPRSL